MFETELLQQRQIKRIISVKELVGGLTNQLFLCEDGETGKKVVYRVYGMIQDDPYERMVELSICTLLGANKIGPNILGEFYFRFQHKLLFHRLDIEKSKTISPDIL